MCVPLSKEESLFHWRETLPHFYHSNQTCSSKGTRVKAAERVNILTLHFIQCNPLIYNLVFCQCVISANCQVWPSDNAWKRLRSRQILIHFRLEKNRQKHKLIHATYIHKQSINILTIWHSYDSDIWREICLKVLVREMINTCANA